MPSRHGRTRGLEGGFVDGALGAFAAAAGRAVVDALVDAFVGALVGGLADALCAAFAGTFVAFATVAPFGGAVGGSGFFGSSGILPNSHASKIVRAIGAAVLAP